MQNMLHQVVNKAPTRQNKRINKSSHFENKFNLAKQEQLRSVFWKIEIVTENRVAVWVIWRLHLKQKSRWRTINNDI